MDEFTDAARKNELKRTIVTGAIFGIFLTFGNAWADFLRECVLQFTPEHEDALIGSLIYAFSASVLCIFVMFCIIRCDRSCETVYVKTKDMKPSELFKIKNKRQTKISEVKKKLENERR